MDCILIQPEPLESCPSCSRVKSMEAIGSTVHVTAHEHLWKEMCKTIATYDPGSKVIHGSFTR